jgi:hypothetical protein
MVHVVSPLRPVAVPAHNAVRSRITASDAASTLSASTGASSPTSTGATASSSPPNFLSLFTGKTTLAAAPPPPPPPPTAESVFGPNPWMNNPTGIGPNGVSFNYNQYYFATPQTAAAVANMVGGKVIQTNQFTPTGGSFAQQQPNYMVQLQDGRMINPGLVASFYTHGYPQSYVDMMVACEVRNA